MQIQGFGKSFELEAARRKIKYLESFTPYMENRSIAAIFYETADLMEIRGDDPFRIRSYRRAAEAVEALPYRLADVATDVKKLLEIPGIGKSMAANIQQLLKEGNFSLHADLLQKYRPSMLELLKIQGLGPKTIALIWDAFQICDVDGVEKLAREGKIRELPRMGEKHEQKILKGIEEYRRISGRFLLDAAERTVEKIKEFLAEMPGIEKITAAGSLRRGKETVGDLDILITGPCCADERLDPLLDRIVTFPGIAQVLAKGGNKVSFRLRSGMQVDVRTLKPESFGAALQYFTGSKTHNVAVRQRALKMGYTLSEYALTRISDGTHVASAAEEEVYAALQLDYIPPELRENQGEIEAAAQHSVPRLLEISDIRGDVHMHTVETDGRCTIEEMIEAARGRRYEYMGITDHSKNLAFANGLDDKRALEHISKIRKAGEQADGIKVFAGIEVDILADGELDLSGSVLDEMDLVIASVHSHFQQEPQQMTDRLLRAITSGHISILGHPTGRILLRREGYEFDLDGILRAASKHVVAMELNAYPDRLDLCDRHLKMAKERGVKIVINTDAHHTSHLEKMRFGVLQARRAWLTKHDVLNTLPATEFANAMRAHLQS
ncbi:MAG TPA: DNA polymerase/3'-5' exonuclease PolX [Terriglobales bacterium]|nr:DNA polymerase/3'-5' exonuclease PolX [Terriglobales bacterium]